MFSWLKSIFVGTEKDYIEKRVPVLTSGTAFNFSKPESISTVYTCIDILSKILAELPLELYIKDTDGGKIKGISDYRYNLLHYNPNNYTTSQNFISTLEAIRNFKGNSFARIFRDINGKIKNFKIIPTSTVIDYNIVNDELYYTIQLTGDKIEIVSSNDILHFKMLTKDGIWGLNPIESLRLNLSASYQGLQTIDKFYENNANSPKAIKSTVSGANQKIMLEAVEKFSEEYAGSDKAGKMLPLPPNTELQELKLNFADAEFINTLKYNASQIAALYGIPGHMVGNTETSKYNNVEQMSIGFKANTIAPIARMYRQEFESKLLATKERNIKSIEFNLMAMIETDHKTRMEGYRILANIGAISPNKIAQIENLPTDPAGDVRTIQMNMMSLDKLKANYNGKERQQ